MLRWFEATLRLQGPADDLDQATDIAHAQLVLVGLQDGLAEAFLQADGYSAELAAPMEDLLQLDRDGTLALMTPPPPTVLIIDQVTVLHASRRRHTPSRPPAIRTAVDIHPPGEPGQRDDRRNTAQPPWAVEPTRSLPQLRILY